MRCLPLTAALLALSLGTACVPLSARTSGAVVTGSLEALQAPENQAHIEALLSDPAVAAAAQRLAAASLAGAIDGLSRPEYEALLAQRSAAFVDALTPPLSAALRTEIGPIVRAELVAAVRESALALSEDPTRRQLTHFVTAMTASVTDTLAPRLWASAGQGLQQDVGPALQAVVTDQLGPALARTLERDLGPALHNTVPPLVAETTRLATREMLSELNTALKGELGETLKNEQRSFFGNVDDILDARTDALEAWITSMAILSAALGALTIGLAWAWWRSRKGAALRQSTVELLTGVIKQQTLLDPQTRALVQAVKETGQDTPQGAWLSSFLDERRHLKVDLGEPEPTPHETDPPPREPAAGGGL
ncbi:MAG: hypothetical protein H6739_30095 [Alphaproteobacteria bacterium]|nr:hypothetical protein [Alphaproteobacteria bacterium]